MTVRERNNRIEYMVTCVGDFASQHAMTPAYAFAFLEANGGIAFLSDCYDVEHSQSIQTAVDDMAEVCRRHGGVFAQVDDAILVSHDDGAVVAQIQGGAACLTFRNR